MFVIHTEKIIELGEGNTLEFKENFPDHNTMAKEMVSFANSEGGKILIGVNDAGNIVGISQNLQNKEEWIMNIARNNCIPAINPKITFEEIINKTIIVVEVDKGLDKPYCTNKDVFYIRVGSTNRTAT